MNTYSIGMIGLGTMGRNLLLNIADHGHTIIGYDKDATKADQVNAIPGYDMISATSDITTFVSSLEKPARIILLVPAGPIVDYVINDLTPLLSEGDIIIDGGNSYYKDTDRRYAALKSKGIHFMGMGVSGGEDGARFGPSIMPSGDKVAYDHVKQILDDVAAKYKGMPCSKYMGNASAGHYVKMVHNGIEYGMMQLIAEAYDLMKNGLGYTNSRMADIFEIWSRNKLEGFLVESAVTVLREKDTLTPMDLIDNIKDVARQKGTGKWTSQDALDLQVPVPTIDLAVVARDLSGFEAERKAIHTLISGQKNKISGNITANELGKALRAAFLITYNQGLHLIHAASGVYRYETSMVDVVNNWKAGCIIRSSLLTNLEKVYTNNPETALIISDPDIFAIIRESQTALKKVAVFVIKNDFGASGFISALTYLNMFSTERSPMNMVQGLRDLFGAHTFERTDRPGSFHQQWK